MRSELVRQLRENHLSPQQFSKRLDLEHGVRVSHQWGCDLIRKDRDRGGDLYAHLHCGGGRRKPYGGADPRSSAIPDRTPISERPPEAERRSEIGHIEVDT